MSGQQRRRLVNDLAGFLAVLHDHAPWSGCETRGSWAHPRPKQAPTEIRAWFGKQVKLSQ